MYTDDLDFDLKYDNLEPIKEEPIRYLQPNRECDVHKSFDDRLSDYKLWFEEDYCYCKRNMGFKTMVIRVVEDTIRFDILEKNGVITSSIELNTSRLMEDNGLRQSSRDIVRTYLNHLLLREMGSV